MGASTWAKLLRHREEVGFLFEPQDLPFKLSEHRLGIAQVFVPQLVNEAKAALLSRTDASELELASMAILLVIPDYFRAWRVRSVSPT